MAGKDKYSKTGLSGFLRYRQDNLTGAERNAFERELQKDPFAEEAEEGFSMMNPDLLRKDVNSLNKKLRYRTVRSGRHMIYRIAASVAVLMVIGTLFIWILKKNPSNNEKIASSESPAPMAKEEMVLKKEPSGKMVNESAMPESKAPGKPVEITPVAAEINRDEKKRIVNNIDSINIIKNSDVAYVKEPIIADGVTSDSLHLAKPELKAAEEAEKTAAGFGEEKARSMPAAAIRNADVDKKVSYPGYIPAEPVTGMDNFNRYIENNLRKPDLSQQSQNLTVIAVFIVRLNGKPDSIRVIGSPVKTYIDEAVRLIKEGPLWKPATENGASIEEEVKVKIVFKK